MPFLEELSNDVTAENILDDCHEVNEKNVCATTCAPLVCLVSTNISLITTFSRLILYFTMEIIDLAEFLIPSLDNSFNPK